MAAAAPVITALTATGVKGMIARFALSVAVSFVINKAFAPDIPEPGAGITASKDLGVQQRIATDTSNKIPVVYGEAKIFGTITYADISSDNQTMAFIIPLCEGPIEAIDYIWWDNYKLTIDGSGNVTNATDLEGNTDDFLNGNLIIHKYPNGGRCSQMEAFSTKWNTNSSNRTMPNLAYLYVELKYDRDKQVTGLSTKLGAEVRGKKVRTIQSDSTLTVSETYSNNPAECLVDYLTNTRYGCGSIITDNDLDLLTFKSHKDFCNDQVNSLDTGGSAVQLNRYETNGFVNTNDTRDINISDLTVNSQSIFAYQLGKFQMISNRALTSSELSAVPSFNNDNMYGQFTVVNDGVNSLKNKMTATFISKSENYKNDQIFREISSNLKGWNETELSEDTSFKFLNNNVQAQRALDVILNQSRETLLISFKIDITGFDLQINDVIKVTNEIYGFTDKLFRINSITETDINNTINGYILTAHEYNANVYSPGLIQAKDLAANSNLPNPRNIGTITPLDIDQNNNDNIINDTIRIQFTIPSGFISKVEVYYTHDAFNVSTNPRIFVKDITPASGSSFTENTFISENINVPYNTTYNTYIYVRPINDFANGSFTAASPFTWVKGTAPATVTKVDNDKGITFTQTLAGVKEKIIKTNERYLTVRYGDADGTSANAGDTSVNLRANGEGSIEELLLTLSGTKSNTITTTSEINEQLVVSSETGATVNNLRTYPFLKTNGEYKITMPRLTSTSIGTPNGNTAQAITEMELRVREAPTSVLYTHPTLGVINHDAETKCSRVLYNNNITFTSAGVFSNIDASNTNIWGQSGWSSDIATMSNLSYNAADQNVTFDFDVSSNDNLWLDTISAWKANSKYYHWSFVKYPDNNKQCLFSSKTNTTVTASDDIIDFPDAGQLVFGNTYVSYTGKNNATKTFTGCYLSPVYDEYNIQTSAATSDISSVSFTNGQFVYNAQAYSANWFNYNIFPYGSQPSGTPGVAATDGAISGNNSFAAYFNSGSNFSEATNKTDNAQFIKYTQADLINEGLNGEFSQGWKFGVIPNMGSYGNQHQLTFRTFHSSTGNSGYGGLDSTQDEWIDIQTKGIILSGFGNNIPNGTYSLYTGTLPTWSGFDLDGSQNTKMPNTDVYYYNNYYIWNRADDNPRQGGWTISQPNATSGGWARLNPDIAPQFTDILNSLDWFETTAGNNSPTKTFVKNSNAVTTAPGNGKSSNVFITFNADTNNPPAIGASFTNYELSPWLKTTDEVIKEIVSAIITLSDNFTEQTSYVLGEHYLCGSSPSATLTIPSTFTVNDIGDITGSAPNYTIATNVALGNNIYMTLTPPDAPFASLGFGINSPGILIDNTGTQWTYQTQSFVANWNGLGATGGNNGYQSISFTGIQPGTNNTATDLSSLSGRTVQRVVSQSTYVDFGIAADTATQISVNDDYYTIHDNDFTDTQFGIKFTFTDGALVTADPLSTYTVSDYSSSTVTSFSSYNSSLRSIATDRSFVTDQIATIINDNTESPIDFIATVNGNNIELTSTTNGTITNNFVINSNHSTGNGDIAYTASVVTAGVPNARYYGVNSTNNINDPFSNVPSDYLWFDNGKAFEFTKYKLIAQNQPELYFNSFDSNNVAVPTDIIVFDANNRIDTHDMSSFERFQNKLVNRQVPRQGQTFRYNPGTDQFEAVYDISDPNYLQTLYPTNADIPDGLIIFIDGADVIINVQTLTNQNFYYWDKTNSLWVLRT